MPKEAIISTPRLNSYGARVLTEGIDLTQYQKNPVLLYMHRRGRKEDMPIGIMENVRVEGDTLYGTPKFDDDTEDERNISKKWERGHCVKPLCRRADGSQKGVVAEAGFEPATSRE